MANWVYDGEGVDTVGLTRLQGDPSLFPMGLVGSDGPSGGPRNIDLTCPWSPLALFCLFFSPVRY